MNNSREAMPLWAGAAQQHECAANCAPLEPEQPFRAGLLVCVDVARHLVINDRINQLKLQWA